MSNHQVLLLSRGLLLYTPHPCPAVHKYSFQESNTLLWTPQTPLTQEHCIHLWRPLGERRTQGNKEGFHKVGWTISTWPREACPENTHAFICFFLRDYYGQHSMEAAQQIASSLLIKSNVSVSFTWELNRIEQGRFPPSP